MKLSFIVPAFNEERLLGATLAAIHHAAQAAGAPYEVLVVDDASTDRTAAVAESGNARVVPVRHRQIAATRNAGARAASGDVFVFVDADTQVGVDVIRAALAAVRAGAVGGGAAIAFDAPVPWPARAMLALTVLGFRIVGIAAGCFVYCTRSAFVAVGGFDERYFGAEEVVLSRALRRQGRFVILRAAVTTSARKLRTHSARELLLSVYGIARRGRGGIREREGLDLWYGPRRDDPRQDA